MRDHPIQKLLDSALQDFKRALVEQNVYDEGHENLGRAYNGAKDFVAFLVEGKKALGPRPPRK